MKIIRVKNTGVDGTWLGQTILANQYYTLSATDHPVWKKSLTIFADVASGLLVVNNGTDIVDDFTDPLKGWDWLLDEQNFALSEIDGKKLAVHSSTKPLSNGTPIYAIWAGAGDDMITEAICEGEMLQFILSPGLTSKTIDVKFHKNNGRVWIHEGYLKFMGGGLGDYLDAEIIGEATPLQTSINLDLQIVNTDTIMYAAGGAGTGTHGWADASKIVLLPRSFSMDGEWDYDGVNLTPNLTNTGAYRIRTVEQAVHKFIHRISAYGDCNTYFGMSSNEASEVLPNYFCRIIAHNVSNSSWNANVLIELFRERTFNP